MGTLIKGGTIIAVDPRYPQSFIGDLRFESGKIIAVGPALAAGEDDEVIDARGAIVMPGLVDSHRHPWQTLMRCLSTDQTVIEYRSGVRGVLAPRYRPEDVFIATLHADLEAINSGVTAVADLAHIMNSPDHADAAVEAHQKSGLRVLFGHGTPSDHEAAAWYMNSHRNHPEDIRRVASAIRRDNSGLLTVGMMARPPFLVSSDVLRHDLELAREIEAHVSMDGGLGGGCWGGRGRWGDTGLQPVKDIAKLEMLGPHLTLVHCNNLDDDELRLIKDSRTHISISPDHEMHCGHGLPATKSLLRHGIEPGLSIDSVIAVSQDMFAAMRSLLAATRGALADRAYAQGDAIQKWNITSDDVLRYGTLRSAEACGLGTSVGSLTPGKQADILILKSDPFNLVPLNDPVAAVVTTAHPGNVDTVFIDGVCKKRDGRLLFPGIGDVIAASEDSRQYVVGESVSEAPIQEWSFFS